MLVGEKVILQPSLPEDLVLLQEWLNSARATGPGLGVRMRSIRDLEKQFEEDGLVAPDRGTLVIGSFESRTVGFCHWWSPTLAAETREVAVFIARPEMRRQGLGGGALRLLVHYLFSAWALERVQGTVLACYPPGLALVRAAGMSEEGRLRHSTFLAGRFEDELVHAILRGEWDQDPRYEGLRRLFADPPEPPNFGPLGFGG